MKNLLKRTSLVGLMILVLLIGCISLTQAQPPQFRGRGPLIIPSIQGDDSMIQYLQKNGKKYLTERAVLWVERGCSSGYEMKKLGSLIDTGIVKIEQYLGFTFDKEHYGEDKIHYFIKDDNIIPHTYGCYEQRLYKKPMIFLPCYDIKGKNSAYFHETVHILAWDYNSIWIGEGLAVYLNDKLGVFPTFPNYGKNLDKGTKKYLKKGPTELFRLIGENGVPIVGGDLGIFQDLSDVEKRVEFYYLAGSFVKFLEGEIGIEKIMQIYKVEDTKGAVVEVTGKTVEEWKKAWLDSLGIQF